MSSRAKFAFFFFFGGVFGSAILAGEAERSAATPATIWPTAQARPVPAKRLAAADLHWEIRFQGRGLESRIQSPNADVFAPPVTLGSDALSVSVELPEVLGKADIRVAAVDGGQLVAGAKPSNSLQLARDGSSEVRFAFQPPKRSGVFRVVVTAGDQTRTLHFQVTEAADARAAAIATRTGR